MCALARWVACTKTYLLRDPDFVNWTMLIKRASRRFITELESVLPVLVGIFFVIVFLTTRFSLGDADIYWHITTGQWIMDHGSLPTVDTYSHTMFGRPWIAKEWLSQLLFAIAYRIGGWAGVATVASIAIAAAFGLMAFFLLDRFAPVIVVLLVLSAYSLTLTQMMARPHALAMPILVSWAWGLIRASEQGKAPSFLMLPLMVLWANIHGSFLIGLALIGPLAFEAAIASAKPVRLLTHWAVFTVLALLATFLTPYGPGTLIAALSVLNLGEARTIVAEWQPQDFSTLNPFHMVLLSAIGFALLLGIKLPLLRIALILVLLHLALSQRRHADVLGLCVPLLLAGPLGRERERAQVHRPAMAVAFVLAVSTFAWAATRQVLPPARATPSAAVAIVKLLNAGPVLNYYDIGGYLIFAGVPTFIDGRTELFGKSFVKRYNQAVLLHNFSDFLTILDEFKIEITLLRPDLPAVGLLDTIPKWKRIYSDDMAVVHIRSK